jgi:hypothetical protein
MHGTKLDLRIWICAMFLVLTSSKGISSVVMARLLGVNQKTAWKLGHAIREMMDDRHGIAGRLSGVVEVDEAFVGGKPQFRHGSAEALRHEDGLRRDHRHGGEATARTPTDHRRFADRRDQ